MFEPSVLPVIINEWREIEDFDNYMVNPQGYVGNILTENLVTVWPNTRGVPTVHLNRDGMQHARSVVVLVANAFVPKPNNAAFDTPIQLDGDRRNVNAENLDWRPRWFALMYRAQCDAPSSYHRIGSVLNVDTGEVFATIRDACLKYGMLEKEVAHAVLNGGGSVFPHYHLYRRA